MAGGEKSDEESVREFVRAMRAEGDPRVAEYDATRARQRNQRRRQRRQDQPQPAQSQSEPRSFDDIRPPSPPPAAPQASTGRRWRMPQITLPAPASSRAHQVAETGAGAVLFVMVWAWVVLPFFKNGPTGVRNVLRAKFFNKAADGSWLP